MRLARTIWLIAAISLLVSTAAPQAFASWQCDGRTCSTGWTCCCLLPSDVRDRNCGLETRSSTGARPSACPATCNCVQTLQSVDSTRPRTVEAHRGPVFQAVLLPPAAPLPAVLPSEEVARSIESRGPPRTLACLATPVLRGPPALTLPFIGS